MFDRRDFVLGLGAAALGSACRTPAARIDRPRQATLVATGQPSVDGAGVKLTRLLGHRGLPHLDPLLMCDRFASDDPRDYLAGFPDHPHRGFETITVMLDGQVRHADSKGHRGLVGPGDIQWMTAGRGIVHSEMPEPVDGRMAGFQLWLNLPAREKMREQVYQELRRGELARGALGAGGEVVLIAGQTLGLQGPIEARATEPVVLTARLEDDRPLDLELPNDHAAFVAVHAGQVQVDDRSRVRAGELAVLSPGNRVRLRADVERAAVLVVAGRPLGEPIARRGPFVMNTDAELERAFADYRAGVLHL